MVLNPGFVPEEYDAFGSALSPQRPPPWQAREAWGNHKLEEEERRRGRGRERDE